MEQMNFTITFEELYEIVSLANYCARQLGLTEKLELMDELKKTILASPEQFFIITDKNPF